eukprot:424421-Prorocentrum_lima.AAC.1
MEWVVEWNAKSVYTLTLVEEEDVLLKSHCHEQLLVHGSRGMCEHDVNMGVAVMYFLGKDLLDYDLNDILVPEDQ